MKKFSKQKIAVIILGISFLFLLSIIPPSDSIAYFIGNLLRVVIIWTVILGFLAYLIWRIGFKKRQGLFLFILSLLFLSAIVFKVGGMIYLGYAETKLNETINTPEFRKQFDSTFQESDILKQELERKGLMSALEKQEGKSFEKIPMNVIKDFLNKNGN